MKGMHDSFNTFEDKRPVKLKESTIKENVTGNCEMCFKIEVDGSLKVLSTKYGHEIFKYITFAVLKLIEKMIRGESIEFDNDKKVLGKMEYEESDDQ